MPVAAKVLVAGGYGHIGRFLVPRLVHAGWEVVVLTRGQKARPENESWNDLPHRHIEADYSELCRKDKWRDLLEELRPKLLVDILSRDTECVHSACRGLVEHLVITGSLWMFGPPKIVPTPEETQNPCSFDAYSERYRTLLSLLEKEGDGPVVSAVMPSNIAGPGKIPLDPYGGRSVDVHRRMAAGEEILLPRSGMTLVCPTDARDIAEVFAVVLEKPELSARRMFNAGASAALTYAEMVTVYGRCYGRDIPVRFVSDDEFKERTGADEGAFYHHRAHMCPDITAARELLGHVPGYTAAQSLERAVEWMREEGLLQ